MPKTVYDPSGRPIAVTREVARGGEGTVFEVGHDPGIVAKIYHRNVDAAKLAAMPHLATPELLRIAAWPLGVLREIPQGRICGILMPKITGHREIHQLYGPAQRRVHFPGRDWAFLTHVAMNCAAAFQTVHGSGHVIGDVNERGILVGTDGTVRLIDCDSFQVRNNGTVFRCTVGVPLYTPPELQNRDFKVVDREEGHDCFGLAVLIFQLLFMGRHPFAGKFAGAGDMPIERAIAERRFSFSARAASYLMSPPPHMLRLEVLPADIAELFERAFHSGPADRPKASEWRSAATTLRDSLTQCTADRSHCYPGFLTRCMWCRLEEDGGPVYFSSREPAYEFDSGFDLFAIWSAIVSASRSIVPTRLGSIMPLGSGPGRRLPREADYRRFGARQATPSPPEFSPEPLPSLPEYAPELRADSPSPEYAEEPIPCVPEQFVPESAPDDPPLELIPGPTPPRWEPRDWTSEVKTRFRRSREFTDYRLARLGAITAGASILPSLFYWPLALATGVIFGVFALAWIIERRPFVRRLRVELAEARAKAASDQAKREMILAQITREQQRVRQINHEKRLDWESECARQRQLRADLPRRNTELRISWAIERDRLKTHAAAVTRSNEQRRLDWLAKVKEHEARRLAEWADELKRAQSARDEIRSRNDSRRADWDAAMRHHRSICEAIAAHNSQIDCALRCFDLERAARRQRLAEARHELEALQVTWERDLAKFEQRGSEIVASLAAVKAEYESVKGQFEQERAAASQNAVAAQLASYLQSVLIADAKIKSIGKRRKSVLLGCGIETALDIDDRSLSSLQGQGFGPAIQKALWDWRQAVARQFRFDTSKLLPPHILRSLHQKYQQRRRDLQRILRSGPEELLSLRRHESERFTELNRHAAEIAARIASADADLDVMLRYELGTGR